MPEKNRGKPSHEEIRQEFRPEIPGPEIPGPEEQGNPYDEDFCPELNENQQIQLKPKKKQSKPFRPELNQN